MTVYVFILHVYYDMFWLVIATIVG